MVLGFELSVVLARQVFYHLIQAPPLFAFSYFLGGRGLSFLLEIGSDLNPPTYGLPFPTQLGCQVHTTMHILLLEMGPCLLFAWAGLKLILLISASIVAGITEVSQHACPNFDICISTIKIVNISIFLLIFFAAPSLPMVQLSGILLSL
jgi:hypothetical protein